MDKPKVTPKDFFMWLGAMGALYVSVGSFIALIFEYIDRLVGDAAIIGYDPYSSGIRFAIASLIVIFPLYVLLTRMLNQDIRKNPEKKELWVRRWLIFLTVFAAGIGLVIDLIVLINTFLGGDELTTSFFLKVLTVFVLFGGVFYYYLQDIRGKWETNAKLSIQIGYVVVAVVILGIIGGFFIMGSPQTQRQLRYDRERIEGLRSLQFQITDYYRDKQALPESLDVLKDPLKGVFISGDPATGESYGYRVLSDLTFEVCANFDLPAPEVDLAKTDRSDWRAQQIIRDTEEWGHDVGETCFEREVDPDKYQSQSLEFIEPIRVR